MALTATATDAPGVAWGRARRGDARGRIRGVGSGVSGRILMIEDDEALSAMVGEYLGAADYRVTPCADAASGLAALAREDFDALVLDVMLPDLDGFEVCRRVRATSEIPILMLTARGDETDRIVGLELGADDYLPKPFNPRELLARLRAILRAAHGGTGDVGDRCVSAASRSIATPGWSAWTARNARSRATSSTCSAPSPRAPAG